MRNYFTRALTLALAAASLHAQNTTLTVQVHDAVTKAPLPNVNLKLERIGEPPTTQATHTGSDGNARFDNLNAGRFHLTYSLEGYVDLQGTDNGRRVRLQDGEAAQTVTIDLTPSGTLEGTMQSAGTGISRQGLQGNRKGDSAEGGASESAMVCTPGLPDEPTAPV